MSASKFGPLVCAIDEGTSSARFMIFKAGTPEVVCYHQKELTQFHQECGYTEQNPKEILEIVTECIDRAIEKLIQLGGKVQDIVAVGVTNQRETTILWNKSTGEPLYNAIVWNDLRTASTVEELIEKTENKDKNFLKNLCGLPISTYFSALKIKWLIDNVPNVKSAIENGECFFGTVDSWLIWNLTSRRVHVTDVSNASRTMLMNISTLDWDSTLCEFFNVPKAILPEIKSSSEVYGHFSAGVLKGIPIAGCLGDQQAALVGQKCLTSGRAKVTYGTGCFLLFNTGTSLISSTHDLLTTVAYKMGKDAPAVYALEGSIAVGGAVFNWLRKHMQLTENAKEMEDLANSVEDNGDVYFVPPLYSWNRKAKGQFVGINDTTQKGHIVRAAMEAICYQVRDIIESMDEDCGILLENLKVDGGMSINNSMMDWQSDIVGIDVCRPKVIETTSLGAAMVAGRAMGIWDDLEDAVHDEIYSYRFKPSLSKEQRDINYSRWKLAVKQSLG